MKNREKDAKNRARSNTRIGRRAGGSVPGLDDSFREVSSNEDYVTYERKSLVEFTGRYQ